MAVQIVPVYIATVWRVLEVANAMPEFMKQKLLGESSPNEGQWLVQQPQPVGTPLRLTESLVLFDFHAVEITDTNGAPSATKTCQSVVFSDLDIKLL